MKWLLLMLITLGGWVWADGVYQWKDAQGKVHFGDNPPKSAASEKVAVTPNVYSSAATPTEDARPRVIMYSTQWCGYCRQARQYFTAEGIPFEERDIEQSRQARYEYEQIKGRGIPVILVGQQRLNGFSAQAFDRLYQ